MNAYETIQQTITTQFDSAWAKELTRFQEMQERAIIKNYDPYIVTGDINATYNTINKKTYSEIQKYRRFVYDTELVKNEYLLFLTANLEKALSKCLTLKSEICDSVQVSVTPKGYKIYAIFESGFVFRTDCIGAGGYNVQCFHYRYTFKYN